ncbi:uncharacterized protein LOC120431102 [Culex pipiens pallens]|uniref:uncharacterized protein LOC120431102 n=1 Tax=Culex pipiens pallens TaxID=42434 RepID=UPI001953D940|nr:uncharacterized protein LOC120431102 [Culex pipiens pallens]
MVLPKRCVNNKIALKKIMKTGFGQVRENYFHGEEKDPTKRRMTRSGIIGGGQTRVRADVALGAGGLKHLNYLPTNVHLATAQLQPNEPGKCAGKTVSFSKENEVLEIKFHSEGLINPKFRMRFQDRELHVQALHFPAGKRRPLFPNQQPTSPKMS